MLVAAVALLAAGATTTHDSHRGEAKRATTGCGGHAHGLHGIRSPGGTGAHALARKGWGYPRHRRVAINRVRHWKRCGKRPRVVQRRIDAARGRYRRQARRARQRERKWRSCRHDAPTASRPLLDCIRGAAIQHGVSYDMLVRKARCESGLNRLARNPSSSASGLFQFLYPSTWSTTPYRGRSVWSAQWNALAAAWMHSVGRGGEWVCR